MKKTVPHIHPEWLSTFLTIAEQGGMLAASRALHISQPALSARIRKLEEAVGQALFDRSAQGMALTEAGRRLLPVARKLPLVLMEAVKAVDPHAGTLHMGPLRLAASTTLANFVFPPLLAEFTREQKVRGLELKVGNTDDVLGAVRTGRVALGAVEGLTRAAGLRLVRFASDEIVPVYAPEALPKTVREELACVATAKAFARLPLLWREPGSGTRRVIEAMFRQRGVAVSDLHTDHVLGGTIALKWAAVAGMGIAFLPRATIGQELALKRLVEVDRPQLRIKRNFSWVLPAGSLPVELEAFRQWVETRLK